ncbi:lysozyme inhibitor LprI family protein [Luteibacter sp. 3190]|uniref:lysozyme inhibitor LprI family protein n=1 Tax=Luteibacter sp. 3190 TaxID=2817736 RepID=UPI002858EBA3|nr:lysozyme inhibitor LprI family protein [Luteibacter sp. 3190]MDR6937393.1 uncharacterized protein YecT (DUF1311 family) [Luteibacter sp. 3190]
MDEFRGRWHQPVGRVGGVRLWASGLAALVVAPGCAVAGDAAAAPSPTEALLFAEKGRTVLAFNEAPTDQGFDMKVAQSVAERDMRLAYMVAVSRTGLHDNAESSQVENVDCFGLPNIKPEASERAAGIRTSYARCMDRAEANFFAIIDCSNAEYLFQDGRLNASYKKRMASLGEKGKKELRAEERLWMKARDSYCNSNEFGGVTLRAVIASCHMFQTAYRAMPLERSASLQANAARSGVAR